MKPTLSKLLTISLFATVIFSACSSEKAKLERVMKMRELSELGTVEYAVSKIILASDDQTWYKVGDRKILFSCEARIKAGVDLSKLRVEDVKLEGDNVSISLPKAQLIYLNMDAEKIKEEYSDISWTRMSYSNQEKDELLVQGQRNIESYIPESGILEEAEKNATLLLKSWLKQAGFNEVEVFFYNPNIISE